MDLYRELILNYNCECNLKYKLVFMDIEMPILDGFEAVDKINEYI